MIGFHPDDQPRDREVIRRPSGLYIAGRDYLDQLDGRPVDVAGATSDTQPTPARTDGVIGAPDAEGPYRWFRPW